MVFDFIICEMRVVIGNLKRNSRGREEEIQNQLLTVCTQWLALLVAWEERAVSCGLSLGTPAGQTNQACQGLLGGLVLCLQPQFSLLAET